MINTHHHLYQWLTRGRATSCDLFTWLQELYPVWARISVEDVEVAATVGLAELALSGATTVADHHYVVPHGDDSVFDAIAAAAGRVGVRLHLSRGSMDLGQSGGGLPPDDVVERTDAILASTESVAARLHDGERVSVVVAPCSPFSVTPELMKQSAELARRLGLRMHTHLAETLDEERDCLARFGAPPVRRRRRARLARGRRVVRARGPLRRLGGAQGRCRRGRAWPTARARTPGWRQASARSANCSTPGLPSVSGSTASPRTRAGDLLPELKQALLLARLRSGSPDALTPAEALELATSGGARCLGRPDLGRLEVGSPADIAVWPADDIADIADAVAGLVLGPSRTVTHLFVGGEAVVSEGSLVGVDRHAVHDELARRARRLWD